MKTVSNIFELTEVVLELIAELICNSNSYRYEMHPARDENQNTNIKIFNNNGDLVLVINDKHISIKDVIAEQINKTNIDEFIKSLGNIPDIVGSYEYELYVQNLKSAQYIQNIQNEIFTDFKYFNTEEQTFQQSTVHSNVLPYESTENIKTIKRKILQDITNKWML